MWSWVEGYKEHEKMKRWIMGRGWDESWVDWGKIMCRGETDEGSGEMDHG
jgi:hypothetical protein